MESETVCPLCGKSATERYESPNIGRLVCDACGIFWPCRRKGDDAFCDGGVMRSNDTGEPIGVKCGDCGGSGWINDKFDGMCAA